MIYVFSFQVDLQFTNEAIIALAKLAMNRKTGARGLRSIMVSRYISKSLAVKWNIVENRES